MSGRKIKRGHGHCHIPWSTRKYARSCASAEASALGAHNEDLRARHSETRNKAGLSGAAWRPGEAHQERATPKAASVAPRAHLCLAHWGGGGWQAQPCLRRSYYPGEACADRATRATVLSPSSLPQTWRMQDSTNMTQAVPAWATTCFRWLRSLFVATA